MKDQSVKPKQWHKAVQSITATRPVAWLLARVLHHIDTAIIKLTSGRYSATEFMTGLPVIMLKTTGAKTGKSHLVPLLALRDGNILVLIASNFGQSHHPAWYYNLCANPKVSVSIGGSSKWYIADEVDGPEREEYWNRAVNHYQGYDAYKDRTRGRKIPIIVLTPTT